MEIEAKYAVVGPLDPAMLERLDLGPYQLRPSGEEQHHDEVLDTPTRALTTQYHELRLRHLPGHIIVTYKGPNLGSGARHEREEIEATFTGALPQDYRQWSPEIARGIAPIVGKATLAPLVEMDMRRRTWRILRQSGTIAELALDEGIIRASGRATPVRELEIELKEAGTREDLTALTQALTDQLPLRPEPRGKLERGLALLRERTRKEECHRPLEEASREVLQRYVTDLHTVEPVARTGTDPEAIHKMRVATRRLRTVLSLLQDTTVFPKPRLRQFRRGLKDVARMLGDVRDLDVLLGRVHAYEEAEPELIADLSPLRQQLMDQRKAAHARLRKHLESAKVAHILGQLETFVQTPVEVPLDQPVILVRHVAGSAIWQRYEAVLTYESVMPGASLPLLHRLRIACKQTRYAMEFFQPALGKRAKPLLKVLLQAQDHLGRLHDAVILHERVVALGALSPDQHGLARYAAELAAERDQLQADFAPRWKQLRSKRFRKGLAGVLGRL